ncbi:MAG: hypothetical protein R2778_09945 [Saprospiraceae bacterium]
MVSDSGTYVVTVTNIQNHCTSTDVVFVDMDKEAPLTNAGPDVTLTCTVDFNSVGWYHVGFRA